MKTHELKCWPEFFAPILSGAKTAELRYNDRNYQAGDVLWLREWEPSDHPDKANAHYTGRECKRLVTHVLNGAGTVGVIAPLKGLNLNYVVMSIRKIEEAENVLQGERGHTDREVASDGQAGERSRAGVDLSAGDRAA